MKRLILILAVIFLTGCSGCKTNKNGGFADYVPWWADSTNSTNSVSTNLNE